MLNRLLRVLAVLGWLGLLGVTVATWWLFPVQPALSWTVGPNIIQVEASVDGSTLATVTAPGPRWPDGHYQVSLWNPATGELISDLKVPWEEWWIGQESQPKVRLSPDGRALIYPSCEANPGECRLWLWHIDAAPPILLPATWDVIAFSADGRHLTTKGRPRRRGTTTAQETEAVRVWEVATGKEVPPAGWLPDKVGSVTALADGRVLSVQNEEGKVLIVWNLIDGSKLAALPGASGQAVFSRDGKGIAACSGDNVKLWELPGGKERAVVSSEPGHWLNPELLGPDSRWLIVRSISHLISAPPISSYSAWDISTESPKMVRDGVLWGWSADGRWIVTEFGGSLVDTDTWQEQVLSPNLWLVDTAFSPDGRSMVASGLSRWPPPEQPPLTGWLVRCLEMIGVKLRDDRPGASTHLYDLTTGRQTLPMAETQAWTWSPDGKGMVRVVGETLEIWDLPPRRPWWIEYGLPMLFSVLIVAAGYRAYRVRRCASPAA